MKRLVWKLGIVVLLVSTMAAYRSAASERADQLGILSAKVDCLGSAETVIGFGIERLEGMEALVLAVNRPGDPELTLSLKSDEAVATWDFINCSIETEHREQLERAIFVCRGKPTEASVDSGADQPRSGIRTRFVGVWGGRDEFRAASRHRLRSPGASGGDTNATTRRG